LVCLSFAVSELRIGQDSGRGVALEETVDHAGQVRDHQVGLGVRVVLEGRDAQRVGEDAAHDSFGPGDVGGDLDPVLLEPPPIYLEDLDADHYLLPLLSVDYSGT